MAPGPRTSSVSEASASTDWAPHVQWLQEAGVSWDQGLLSFGPGTCGGSASSSKSPRGSTTASASDAGVEAFARTRVDPGSELCWIPYSSVLSVANSKQRKILKAKDKAVASLDDDVLLTLAILGEMQLGTASRWYGYLQSLPQSPLLLPTGWSDEHLQWLRGTELDPNDVKEERRGLKRCFDQTKPVLRKMGLLRRDSSASEIGRLRRDFMTARGWVSSRAFATPEPRHGSALTPLMDIFNHRHDGDDIELSLEVAKGRKAKSKYQDGKQKRTKSTKRGACFVVMSMRSLKKGQVVRNRYGDFANCVLLRKHGFCIPGNPHDVVYIRRSNLISAAKQDFGRRTASSPPQKVSFAARLRVAGAMEAAHLFGPCLQGPAPSSRGQGMEKDDDDFSSSDSEDQEDDDSDDEGTGPSPWIALSLCDPIPSNLLGLLAVLLATSDEELALIKALAASAESEEALLTMQPCSPQARTNVKRLFPKLEPLLQESEKAAGSASSLQSPSTKGKKKAESKTKTKLKMRKRKSKATACKMAAKQLFKACPAAAGVLAKVVADRLGKYSDDCAFKRGRTAEEKRCFAAASILRRSELGILKQVQGIACAKSALKP